MRFQIDADRKKSLLYLGITLGAAAVVMAMGKFISRLFTKVDSTGILTVLFILAFYGTILFLVFKFIRRFFSKERSAFGAFYKATSFNTITDNIGYLLSRDPRSLWIRIGLSALSILLLLVKAIFSIVWQVVKFFGYFLAAFGGGSKTATTKTDKYTTTVFGDAYENGIHVGKADVFGNIKRNGVTIGNTTDKNSY